MSGSNQYIVLEKFDPLKFSKRKKALHQVGSILKEREIFTPIEIAKKIPTLRRFYIARVIAELENNGYVKKTEVTSLDEFVAKYETVQYFAKQLKKTQYVNLKREGGTQLNYISIIRMFHRYLEGRKFTYKKTIQTGISSFDIKEDTVVLHGADHFLRLYQESFHSEVYFIKMIKNYLLDDIHEGKKPSYMKSLCSVIKSYFEKNDSKIEFSFDATANHQKSNDEPVMSLEDLLAMLTEGQPSVMEKALVLCKFHRGIDNSTFVDSFNYEAWAQLVEYFGTEEFERWDESRCPVLIKLVRVKTQFTHIGFLDVDAIVSLKKYLKYRYQLMGKVMSEGVPLFVTKKRQPIPARQISRIINRLAKDSGVQRSLKGYKLRTKFEKGSHELRDLLDSTLDVCGVNPFLSEHTLGHKQSSYKKQHMLYPEQQREEFAKASSKLNIFSNITHHMKQGGMDEKTKAVVKRLMDYYETNEAQKRQYQKEIWNEEKAIDAPSFSN